MDFDFTEIAEFAMFQSITLLLPIIPAYILYKSLPSEAQVDGPFKGLNIKLTGAFGGYFLLVMISIAAFLAMQNAKPAPAKTEFRYSINFPVDSSPDDLTDTVVIVHKKPLGKGDWIAHGDFEKIPTFNGIMVSIKNIKASDTIYVSAKYRDKEWETEKSITVPVDHLSFQNGHGRKAFSQANVGGS